MRYMTTQHIAEHVRSLKAYRAQYLQACREKARTNPLDNGGVGNHSNIISLNPLSIGNPLNPLDVGNPLDVDNPLNVWAASDFVRQGIILVHMQIL